MQELKDLTKHRYIKLTTRGNTAIDAACHGKRVLIPEEGGWMHYQKKSSGEVKCVDAQIDMADLRTKLETRNYDLFLYQNPGGYFAEQPSVEIYELCQDNNCLVVIDVSGSIGTKLCNGDYADILVGSFGRWKLVDAGVGGFISCKKEGLFNNLDVDELKDEVSINKVRQKLENLPQRINLLSLKRKKILDDLNVFNIVRPNDYGLVVIVRYTTTDEKERILSYCKNNYLPWIECPRYIRINRKAISIEVKRL